MGRWVQNMRLPCFLASIQHKYFFPRRAQRPLRKWGPSGDLEGVGQQRRPRRAPSGNWPTPQMQVALKVPLITQRFGAASGAHDPPSSGLSLPMLQCPTDKPEHIRTEECTVVHNVYLKVLIPLSRPLAFISVPAALILASCQAHMDIRTRAGITVLSCMHLLANMPFA